MKSEIKVLLVEDLAKWRKHFGFLCEDLMGELDVVLDVDPAENYQVGMEKLKRGAYHLVILDLVLSGDRTGKSKVEPKMEGVDLIATAKKMNKDSIIGVFSANAPQAVGKLIGSRSTMGLIDKSMNRQQLGQLKDLVLLCQERFNFEVDLNLAEAYQEFATKEEEQDRLTVCLQRVFRSAQGNIAYLNIGERGKSSAKVVEGHAKGWLAIVLKSGCCEDLVREVENYDAFVKRHVPRAARTSFDDLAHVGETGLLAYDLIGGPRPRTLGDMLSAGKLDLVLPAIESHFQDNCRSWFGRTEAIARPQKLDDRLREILKISGRWMSAVGRSQAALSALEAVCAKTEVSRGAALLEELEVLIDSKMRRVRSKPFTIAHGDLNVNNLLWQDGKFWLIDFECCGDQMPRLFDFAKLEVSAKLDDWGQDFPPISLDQEEDLVRVLIEGGGQGKDENKDVRLSFIKCIREQALTECGDEAVPVMEYAVCLFYITVKHIQYIERELLGVSNEEIESCSKRFATAVYSALVIGRLVTQHFQVSKG